MFSIGIDYGTNSVRALVVGCEDGFEYGTCVFNYPSGDQGVILDPANPLLARQSAADYLEGLEHCVKGALAEAARHERFDVTKVIGIGVDTTGSSPLPVDAQNRALSMDPHFADNLNAFCWLWKDHTSWQEAETITKLGKAERPEYLAMVGDTYSSEWWWSKIWHCLNVDEAVFDAAASWVEIADWIPSVLAGVKVPAEIKRGVCAAGHKGLYNPKWGGLPDKEFLNMLDPKIAALRDRLYDTAQDISVPAGALCSEWAQKLGLPVGIAIATGAFDNHLGSIGCGIEEGMLVKVIGTSTCDCAIVDLSKSDTIPGVCGIVEGSILPGFFGIEAGQSAVGDIFKWWVERVCEGDAALHARLTEEATGLKPGQSGLLALDWNNGNRTILVDQRLTGLIMGQTLYTSRSEIYRALVEATAFGARAIVERMTDYGVPIDKVVCAGGIAEKNPMLMQIYADVMNRTMLVTRSAQTCALGAAVAAAAVAGSHDNIGEATRAMTGLKDIRYDPIPENVETYEALYGLYLTIHDGFGGITRDADLSRVMKDLIDIRDASRR